MCHKRKKTASCLTLADKRMIEKFVTKAVIQHFSYRENRFRQEFRLILREILEC